MNKLFAANFMRLWKNKPFWICIAATAILIMGVSMNQYSYKVNYNARITFDDLFHSFAMLTGFCLAIFSCLYLGTEYSDGTIRNKIVAGHTRSNIYMVNFCTCLVTGSLFNLAFILTFSCIGIPMFGFFTASAGEVISLILTGAALTLNYAAFFTMRSMLHSNKANNAVISLLYMFVGSIIAFILISRLQEPECIEGYVMTVDGISEASGMPNPLYIRGWQRIVFQYLLELFPTGQGLQLSSGTVVHPIRMIVISLLETAAFTTIGLTQFAKREMK